MTGCQPMLALLLVACATGLGCGLARLKVWALIPASNVFGVIAVVLGSYLGHTVGGIALTAFLGLTLLQVAYLIGTVVSDTPTRHRYVKEKGHHSICEAAGVRLGDPIGVHLLSAQRSVRSTSKAALIGVRRLSFTCSMCWNVRRLRRPKRPGRKWAGRPNPSIHSLERPGHHFAMSDDTAGVCSP